MSKSAATDAGLISLLDSPTVSAQEDSLRGHRQRAGRSASTRWKRPASSNLLSIQSRGHRRRDREAGRTGMPDAVYGDLKKDTAEAVRRVRHADQGAGGRIARRSNRTRGCAGFGGGRGMISEVAAGTSQQDASKTMGDSPAGCTALDHRYRIAAAQTNISFPG